MQPVRTCHRRPTLFLVLTGLAGTAHAAHFLDLREQHTIRGDAAAGAAKSTVCVACHGPNGNSVIPTFPRLAGQRVNYLYWRLAAFKRYGPTSSPMAAIARTLTESEMRNLAVYFAAQAPMSAAPAPGGSAAPGHVTDGHLDGRSLYLEGDRDRGIPPCQGCHGANADGPPVRTGPFAAYPVLRGQHASYLVSRLNDFHKGTPQQTTNDFIMHGVALSLDAASIQLIADWLDALPPRS